jgi:hypothetical protein
MVVLSVFGKCPSVSCVCRFYISICVHFYISISITVITLRDYDERLVEPHMNLGQVDYCLLVVLFIFIY